MKKMKLLSLLPLLLVSGLTSCDTAQYHIGICQLVAHPALDKATKGFIKAVQDGLGKGNVAFDRQLAAGDPSTCLVIANKFVNKNVDLIMANATPALQAVANSTRTIPVLGTSVTEYGVALGIKDFNGAVGGNISGTSDLAPLDEQAAMVKEFVPTAQKVGLLYCSAEANSLYQVDTVEKVLKEDGLETKRIPFSDSNDLSLVLNANVTGLDALYVPTDNTCADNVTIIDNICRPKKLPIICGEEGICKGCGIATLSIDYFNLGMITGQMAVEILKDNKDISKMAIAYDESPVKKYNKTICEDLGITVPTGYIAIE